MDRGFFPHHRDKEARGHRERKKVDKIEKGGHYQSPALIKARMFVYVYACRVQVCECVCVCLARGRHLDILAVLDWWKILNYYVTGAVYL